MGSDKSLKLIAAIPTFSLLSMLLLTVIVVYFIAWYYKTEYNPIYHIRAYLIYLVPFGIISLILDIKVILILGIYVLGMIILIFRNQHYFDQ